MQLLLSLHFLFQPGVIGITEELHIHQHPYSPMFPFSPSCSSLTSSAPVGMERGSTVELSLATSKVASLEKKLKERDDQYMAQSQELTELLKKGAAVCACVHAC